MSGGGDSCLLMACDILISHTCQQPISDGNNGVSCLIALSLDLVLFSKEDIPLKKQRSCYHSPDQVFPVPDGTRLMG